MKIRTGFVSNSSSTSFCIIGYNMDLDELKKDGKMIGEEYYVLDFYQNFFSDAGFDARQGEHTYSGLYIGYSVEEVIYQHIDKSTKQLRQELSDKFKSLGFNITPDQITYEHAGWYDG